MLNVKSVHSYTSKYNIYCTFNILPFLLVNKETIKLLKLPTTLRIFSFDVCAILNVGIRAKFEIM